MFTTKLKGSFDTLTNDRKTYIVVVAALIIGVIDGTGIYNIPNWVFEILPFIGLGTVRHAIQKSKKAAEESVKHGQENPIKK